MTNKDLYKRSIINGVVITASAIFSAYLADYTLNTNNFLIKVLAWIIIVIAYNLVADFLRR